MKINADRLFPYPMLAEGRDDYKTCKFDAKIKPSYDAADNLILESNFSTDCAEIKNLIADGSAEYLLHVECPATIYRETFNQSRENFLCKVPLNRVKKNLDCVALIVLRKDVENFSCRDWNDDFTWLTFNLAKGSVLAYQNFQPLTLPEDKDIFKNVSSIFSVYKKLGSVAPFDVEITSEKIKIGLNEKDYLRYRRYCSNPKMQPILNAMIILPALVYVFEELKIEGAEEVHNSSAWFLSLAAAYRRKKINFVDHLYEEDSFHLAQEVMNLPLTKALENIALICEDAAEDS